MDRAPIEQPHRLAEIGFDDEIAIGRGGLGNGAEMDDGVQLAAAELVQQFGRRNEVRELAFGEIAPFAVVAEPVADRDVGTARFIERGHDVRSDKTGTSGHQQHEGPCPDCAWEALPQSRPASNLGRDAWQELQPALPPDGERLPTGRSPLGTIRPEQMNDNSSHAVEDPDDRRAILVVPYMWIGDFVRGHTVVRVLKQRWPSRPVDVLVTPLCAPLVDYMPGIRSGVVWDLPRSRLAVAKQWGLANDLRARNYGTALVLPRTWKSAIAPALAGIPERVGFVGEARFGLLNRWRWGEKALPRFIDKNAALALPDGAPRPAEWPVPQLQVPAAQIGRWRQQNGLGAGAAIA